MNREEKVFVVVWVIVFIVMLGMWYRAPVRTEKHVLFSNVYVVNGEVMCGNPKTYNISVDYYVLSRMVKSTVFIGTFFSKPVIYTVSNGVIFFVDINSLMEKYGKNGFFYAAYLKTNGAAIWILITKISLAEAMFRSAVVASIVAIISAVLYEWKFSRKKKEK